MKEETRAMIKTETETETEKGTRFGEYILSIDPGETLGLAVLNYSGDLLAVDQRPCTSFKYLDSILDYWFLFQFVGQDLTSPTRVIIEDYRIYRSKANLHIGRQLITSEFIGAIELKAAQLGLSTVRVSASTKGRWPEARIQRWYARTLAQVPKPHALDAWLLGLSYLESQGWSPSTRRSNLPLVLKY